MPEPAARCTNMPSPVTNARRDDIRFLRLEAVAPGSPYHAALSITEAVSARGYRVTAHTHDFYEMIFVLAGTAVHGVNDVETELHERDLILLRPGDWHFIRFHTGKFLHYINIALDAALWRDFVALAGIKPGLDAPVVRSVTGSPLSEEAAAECAAAFQRVLERFQRTGMTTAALRTEACRFLATITPSLSGSEDLKDSYGEAGLPDSAPAWLNAACRHLQRDTDALQRGLPALVSAAGVTRTHLARVLKAATGETPTEYVNRLRLERAATLLTTTTLSILEISIECGFEQAAYFYRLFRARFQTSPHAYRMAASHRVAPKSLLRRGYDGTI